MRSIFAVCAVFWGLFAGGVAVAQDWSLLKEPGAVVLMRHALAPGTGDPADFELRDCTTQRNLDDRGRAQAREIGEMMRASGVAFDAVWSSQWCRCLETAKLLDMGKVTEAPSLNSHFAGQGDREAQTKETLARIRDLPEDQIVLLVTHQVNVRALSGSYARSGEIVVTRRTPDGLEVTGTIAIEP
ncbi:histidine phosphatase family protein [Roseovarius aestuariivivens]|uniref:histidine phosphatase family protein n=1 Tax=Roseovarius aestuariivivens TaxID=1888910 RepID=UPI001AEBDCD9|nr:histidine phosphatase family protein [Roseovarius aestuariivivens]